MIFAFKIYRVSGAGIQIGSKRLQVRDLNETFCVLPSHHWGAAGIQSVNKLANEIIVQKMIAWRSVVNRGLFMTRSLRGCYMGATNHGARLPSGDKETVNSAPNVVTGGNLGDLI